MNSEVISYHISETGKERNVVTKKEQTNLARLVLVFKVMVNSIYITGIFKVYL